MSSRRLVSDVPGDAPSRRAIREDLHANLLVEAGAGSGKTQMLAERMASGIATGVYEIGSMAAVTFTRKAASELRGRFHLALEQRLVAARRDADAAAVERLEYALGNLERFFAGTIHSFCARLLRERPVESGVSPGFTELDEVQDEELRNRAWRDFVTARRAAGDPMMLELLETGVRPKDLDSAFAIVCTNEDVEFPPGDAACPDPKPAWQALEKFWKELEKLLPPKIEDAATCPVQKAAREFRAKLRVASKRLNRPATIADLLETWKFQTRITQGCWATTTAEKKRYKAIVEPLHAAFLAETVTDYLSRWRQYVYRLSVSLLMAARAHAARERHRRNSLNYGDLLNLTARVLRNAAPVRRALQQKYRNLFVDEFQDTDPVQAEIIFLLAADEGPAAAGVAARHHSPFTTPGAEPDRVTSRVDVAGPLNWRAVALRPGALFVVGDPKQSIYRFRRADIEIYNAVRDRFSDGVSGRVVPLTTNFRSVPGLCVWANDVFAQYFPAAPSAHSPQFAPLHPHVDREDAARPAGLFTLTHDGEGKEVAANDAGAIARYVRAEVDAGRRRFSDFLILTRKKKDRIGVYASALEALNIPIEVSGAGAFGESAEVEALTVLLRALADPQDQLTLVNVLRGPLFGISDVELFEYTRSGRWLSIFAPDDAAVGCAADMDGAGESAAAPAPIPADGAARVADAIKALKRCFRWTRMLPAGAAVERILEDSGYLALAATTPGGVEAGDLLHAVDRVRQVVEDGGNLADAADALAADTEASNEVESLPLEPGRTDVVRLMNLHKAKGLEAAVVFLADPCGGVGRWVDVHIRRDGARALGWFKVERKSEGSFAAKLLGEHKDWAQHKQAEEPYLEAEEKRLLYVAATRAREMLVVSRYTGSVRNPAWQVLNQHLAGAKELPVPASVTVARPRPATWSAKVQAEGLAARFTAEGLVSRPSWSITSVTAEARHIARMAAAADPGGPAEPDDATRVVTQDTPSHRADAGMAWGTLIHGLLEHAMRHPGSTREDLRRLAMWLTVEEPQLRTVLDEAIDTVERVAQAHFWVEAQRHPHSVETPFFVAEAGQLANGVIDLMFERTTGWEVVDYKTDRTLADGKYAAQLETYRRALQQAGCQVAGASIVNVRTDPA